MLLAAGWITVQLCTLASENRELHNSEDSDSRTHRRALERGYSFVGRVLCLAFAKPWVPSWQHTGLSVVGHSCKPSPREVEKDHKFKVILSSMMSLRL